MSSRREGIVGAQIAWSPDGRHIVAGRDPRVSEGVVRGPLSDPRGGWRASRDYAAGAIPRSILLPHSPPTVAALRTVDAVQSVCSCRCCCPTGAPFAIIDVDERVFPRPRRGP